MHEPRAVRKAIYAGSFDPPTLGHLWMIREGSALFDELNVAVGVNPDKKCAFDLDARMRMLRAIVEPFDNVRIVSFRDRFLVDFAAELGVEYVIRGIRSQRDYEYERTMRHVNADIRSDVSTVFLIPPRRYEEVSSSMVKGLIGPKGWTNVLGNYVPEPVRDMIVERWRLDHGDDAVLD